MKTTIFLLDVSNWDLRPDVQSKLYGKGLSGAIGNEVKDWSEKRDQRRIVIAKLHSATTAAEWRTLELPSIPVSEGKSTRLKRVQEAARQVREAVELKTQVRAKGGTQIVMGLQRLCEQRLAGGDTTIYVVSDGFEQSEIANFAIVKNKKTTIYTPKVHGKLERDLAQGMKRVRVDLKGAKVVFWLTGGEASEGQWNQVIGTVWGNALKQVGAGEVSYMPINSVPN